MSDIYELLMHSLGTGDELQEIARGIGADPAETQRGIAAALPTLLGALSNNASTADGAASLFGALDDHDGSVLGMSGLQGLLGGSLMGGVGNAILGHVLGSQMERIAGFVAAKSGLDKNLVMKLLPVLAPIVLGFLGKMKKDQGMGLDDLTSILAQEKQQTVKKEPGLGGLLDALTGGGDDDDGVDMGDLLGGVLGGGGSGGGLGSILGKVLGA
jgi:hypothetical protein